MSELDKKIQSSIRLIKSLDGLVPELAYSGGKDSDVILALAQMSGINFRPIYKMTTIDPPGTIAHVKSKGVEIMRPKKTFFQLIEGKGFPTFRARFCCSELKEYKILDKCILGIRKEESAKRKKLYKEPSACRIYSNKERVEQFFPILEWTNEDICEFVNYYGIECHSLYYKNGIFDSNKRLGCMGCPLKHDRGLSDFKSYPLLVKQWIKHGNIWFDTHTHTHSRTKFQNVYNLFFHNVFCDSYYDYIYKTTGLFGNLDTKKFMEDYFNVDLTI